MKLWRHFASVSCGEIRVEKRVLPGAGAAEKRRQRHPPHLLTRSFAELGLQQNVDGLKVLSTSWWRSSSFPYGASAGRKGCEGEGGRPGRPRL